MDKARVVIIGAGPAGVAALTRLHEKGFKNVKVLEAEDRIGGRICTVPFGKGVVDLGAQWCHGEKDNVVYNLVKDMNLLSSSKMYDNSTFINSQGQEVPENVTRKLLQLYSIILEEHSEEMKDSSTSLGHFFTDKYYKLIKEDETLQYISRALADQCLEVFHKFETSMESSDSWWEVSGRGYLEYWNCEGDRLLNWKQRGYKTILDVLMKKYPYSKRALPIDDLFVLNKEVANIEWQQSPADTPVLIRCQDGETVPADHVVVTVSLGVLKNIHRALFSPELPKFKVNAIQGLGTGAVDKIFLEFNERFWDDDFSAVSMLWREEDKPVYSGGSKAWLLDVFGMFTVDFQPNVLCGWVTGDSARVMESLDEQQVIDGCFELLQRFLGKKYPKLTKPIAIKRTTWFSNPHFRGSYSFRSLESDRLGATARQMATPLKDFSGRQVVLFAGEATHDHYYSTVHGAIESGWREADRLVDMYTKVKSNL